MSTTLINYDLVVQELTRNMHALDGDMARSMPVGRDFLLRDLRTVYLGAGRQQGITDWSYSLVANNTGKALVLSPNFELSVSYIEGFRRKFSNKENPLCIPDRPDNLGRTHRFNLVIVVGASHYFTKFSLAKVYRDLAECTTDDVIIYQLN